MKLRTFLKIIGLAPAAPVVASIVTTEQRRIVAPHPNSLGPDKWSDDPVVDYNIRADLSLSNLLSNPHFVGKDAFTISENLKKASDFGEYALLQNLSEALLRLRNPPSYPVYKDCLRG